MGICIVCRTMYVDARISYTCSQLQCNTIFFSQYGLVGSSDAVGIKDGTSLTIAANYSNVTTYIDDVVHKAAAKFNAGAFMHWYEKHGCERDTFLSAFDTLQTIVKDYDDAIT